MIRPHSLAIGLLSLSSAAACTPAPNILPTNDLNRPTDITFMCLGAYGTGTPGTDADGNPTETGPFVVTGRPMKTCHHPSVDDMSAADQPPASMHNRTFAFVPNSASGDLSVIDGDSWKLVDMDKSTSGYGRVPLGALPEQISSTTDGCRLMTANRGSCDLSLVDPSALLAGTFASQFNSPSVDISIPAGNGLQRIKPTFNGEELHLSPYEAVFLPRDTSGMMGSDNLCPSESAAPPEQWHAIVTFPSCDLVALIDLPSGEIQKLEQVRKDATGKVSLVPFSDLSSCRADCGGGRAPTDAGASTDGSTDDGSADGGTSDGGASDSGTSTGTTELGKLGPTSIAIVPRGNQAYVSLSGEPAILSLSLSPATLTLIKSVALHDTSSGSNRIRLGVDPWADPTDDYPGKFISATGANQAYLYVIARDGSLRVIDVFSPGSEKECETNFDPLDPQIDPNQPVDVSPGNVCIPYGSVKRRPYSTTSTAGLRFPTMPVDVAAANLSGDSKEDTVNGGYAWVLTASGNIYLVNISPAPRSIKAVVHMNQSMLFPPGGSDAYAAEPFVYKNGVPDANNLVFESTPFPNQPRDRNVMSYTLSLDPTLGPTRLDLPPLQATGPYIEPLWTMGTEQDATALDNRPRQTYVFFPDRNAAVAQGWDVTWQGTVVSPRYSGVLNGNKLKDGGGQFCTLGVQTGDIVTLRGCTTDADCPLGLICDRDQSIDQVPGGYKVSGLCLSKNLLAANGPGCSQYASSVRRYEIVQSSETELTLAPHLDEVVRSGLSQCGKGLAVPAGAVGTGGTGGATGMGGASGTTGAGGTGGGGTSGAAGAGGAGTGGTGGTGGLAGVGGMAGRGGTGGAADPDDDCHDPIDPSTAAFKCFTNSQSKENRCLNPCVQNGECRHGRVCLVTCAKNSDCASGVCDPNDGQCHARPNTMDANGVDANGCNAQRMCLRGEACVDGQCEIQSFCADGPPLGADQCFPQLTSYQINVNAGFLVTGSQAGSYAAGRMGANGCEALPKSDRDQRLVSRIPMRATPSLGWDQVLCDQTDFFPPVAGFDHFDPSLKPTDADGDGKLDLLPNATEQQAPQLVEWMNKWTGDVSAPNACLYIAGPIASDIDRSAQHVRARFRNTQVAFVLADIDRAPPSTSTVHFDVHGGFRQQAVVNLTTVQVSAPARLVLGPVDSTRIDNIQMKAAPFFFVVDQRRLGTSQGGGPTRGQIVRVNPFGLAANGYLPVYEDYHASNGLFPIQ